MSFWHGILVWAMDMGILVGNRYRDGTYAGMVSCISVTVRLILGSGKVHRGSAMGFGHRHVQGCYRDATRVHERWITLACSIIGARSCGLVFMSAIDRTVEVSRDSWQVTGRIVWDLGHWNGGVMGHRHGRI